MSRRSSSSSSRPLQTARTPLRKAEPTAANKAAAAGVFSRYMSTLDRLVQSADASDGKGKPIALEAAVVSMGKAMRKAHDAGNRIFFVGNGGSAGICSHMATDCSKNGGIRSSALNDGSVLTCLGNDYGYEHVFAKQLEWHARKGDVVVAISSSGKSANILNAADVARRKGCKLFTYSGFSADNPLRKRGDVNVFVDSPEYGFVEVGHLAIMHGVLDIQMGWNGAAKPAKPTLAARGKRGNGRR